MKLALFSSHEAPRSAGIDARVRRLIGAAGSRGAYIPSAPHPEHLHYMRKRDDYAQLGIDLRVHVEPDAEFGATERRQLMGCDVVHLSGGNTFAFLAWLRRCGLVDVLRAYARDGGVVVGESAGAILMTPDVRSALLCGDTPDGDVDALEAVGLVSFHFWPHFAGLRGTAPEEFLQEFAVCYGCPDGGAVVVDGDAVELFGEVIGLQRGVALGR